MVFLLGLWPSFHPKKEKKKKKKAVVSAANESENGVCNCRKVLWSFKFKIVKSKEEEEDSVE